MWCVLQISSDYFPVPCALNLIPCPCASLPDSPHSISFPLLDLTTPPRAAAHSETTASAGPTPPAHGAHMLSEVVVTARPFPENKLSNRFKVPDPEACWTTDALFNVDDDVRQSP